MTVTYVAIVAGQMTIAMGDISATNILHARRHSLLLAGFLSYSGLYRLQSRAPSRRSNLNLKMMLPAIGRFFLRGNAADRIANGAFGTPGPGFFGASVGPDDIHKSPHDVRSPSSSGAVNALPAVVVPTAWTGVYVLAASQPCRPLSCLAITIVKPQEFTLLYRLDLALWRDVLHLLYSITVCTRAIDYARQ